MGRFFQFTKEYADRNRAVGLDPAGYWTCVIHRRGGKTYHSRQPVTGWSYAYNDWKSTQEYWVAKGFKVVRPGLLHKVNRWAGDEWIRISTRPMPESEWLIKDSNDAT